MMKNAVQDLAAESHAGARNTGFPEPLSTERNTTLPHPGADTSPHASIEAADIPLNRTASRLKFNRKHSKTGRNTSSGSIPIAASLLVGPEHLYANRDQYHREKAQNVERPGKEGSPESGTSVSTDPKLSFERGSSAEGLSRGDSVTGSQKKRRNFLQKLRKH